MSGADGSMGDDASDLLTVAAECDRLREALRLERAKAEDLRVELGLLRSRDTIPAPPLEGYFDGVVRGALAEFAAHDLDAAIERTLRRCGPELIAEGIALHERQRSEGAARCDDCPRRVVGVDS